MRENTISATRAETARLQPRAIVAVPVQNEAERIGTCLQALAGQVDLDPGELGIVLFLNNCTDETAAVVGSADMPWPMRVILQDDPAASAGWARRIAMSAASAWLAESSLSDGVLLTTDADSRVAPDWVTRNLSAIAAGADLVAGRISLDSDEAARLPDRLHARGRLEAAYEALLTELDARLDPDPSNPWPCHWSKSGATLAVRHSSYLAVGGMPNIATGEDRAFVDAIRARDFVVRHPCDIDVVTSGRLDGRASNGVADTIKLRCDEPDSLCDDRLEPVLSLIRRALWRRRLRRLHREGRLSKTWTWAPALAIRRPIAQAISASQAFGRAHAAIETASPRLAYSPIRPKHLPHQIRRATNLLRMLRVVDRLGLALRRPRASTSTAQGVVAHMQRPGTANPW